MKLFRSLEGLHLGFPISLSSVIIHDYITFDITLPGRKNYRKRKFRISDFRGLLYTKMRLGCSNHRR